MVAFFRFIAIALITLALVGVNSTQWLEQTFPSYVANAAETVLSWPGWAVIGVLGLAIGALTLSPRYDEDED
jgi:hypothetical protein